MKIFWRSQKKIAVSLPGMDKRRLTLLIIAIVLGTSLLTLLGLRFIFGGSEDTWLCVGNQWVKHGSPAAPMPADGCGIVSKDATADWPLYANSKYGLEVKHSPLWKAENYGPFGLSSLKLYQILFSDASQNVIKNPARRVFWTIDIWKPTVTNAKIAQDSGFVDFDVKNLDANAQSSIESSQPSAITDKTETFRLFVIEGKDYVYSLKSDLCSDVLAVECSGVLNSFKLIEQ